MSVEDHRVFVARGVDRIEVWCAAPGCGWRQAPEGETLSDGDRMTRVTPEELVKLADAHRNEVAHRVPGMRVTPIPWSSELWLNEEPQRFGTVERILPAAGGLPRLVHVRWDSEPDVLREQPAADLAVVRLRGNNYSISTGDTP